MTSIQSEHFTKALLGLLDETFDEVHGFYLDKGTSLFETLAGVSAEQASKPVGGRCASLAAQVSHTAYYLEEVVQSVTNPDFKGADWGAIWQTVEAVSDEEWQAIQADLRAQYEQIKHLVANFSGWSSDAEIGGALSVLAHTAYHLGEIRQALCIL